MGGAGVTREETEPEDGIGDAPNDRGEHGFGLGHELVLDDHADLGELPAVARAHRERGHLRRRRARSTKRKARARAYT